MQTAFVTGASAGLGLAIAERLLREDWRVVASARRLDRLEALAAKFPGRVYPLAMDVSNREDIEKSIAKIPAELQGINALVNNAGLALGLVPAHTADPQDWDQMILTNCAGLAHVTRQLLPQMVERGSGTILHIGSVAGEFPYPGGHIYGATKAFVRQFSQNLNADLVGTGVRSTCIEPGLVGGTEFSNIRFKGDSDRAASIYAGTQPLTAIDIAETVWWAIQQPAHVTINVISMMPNCQSFSPLTVRRG